MKIRVPLEESQIDAACNLYLLLPRWETTDAALTHLAHAKPDMDLKACLLKTVAINNPYSTMVFAELRMAEHVHRVLNQEDTSDKGPELVERLAALYREDGTGIERRFRSFASKFAHFFLDSERFPILDSWADQMIVFRLGNERKRDVQNPYAAFSDNFFALKNSAGVEARPIRDLDRYLWLAGQYRRWLKPPNPTTGREIRKLFEEANPTTKTLLNQLHPGSGPDLEEH